MIRMYFRVTYTPVNSTNRELYGYFHMNSRKRLMEIIEECVSYYSFPPRSKDQARLRDRFKFLSMPSGHVGETITIENAGDVILFEGIAGHDFRRETNGKELVEMWDY